MYAFTQCLLGMSLLTLCVLHPLHLRTVLLAVVCSVECTHEYGVVDTECMCVLEHEIET